MSRRRLRSARARGRAVRAGRVGRAAHAAGALEHLHRQVSARARRPRQRRLLPRPRAGRRSPRSSRRAAIAPAAFVAAYVLDSKWGINQGFDTYFDDFDLSQVRGRLAVGASSGRPTKSLDKALPWIETVEGSPFFAWIHLYDPHAPYRPPEPFASRYKGHPYNGEIAFADSQVGASRLAAAVARLYDRTVVVVMGDHGESLGDHGEGAHGFFVYNSVTHVPFVDPRAVQPDRGIAASPIRCDRWT